MLTAAPTNPLVDELTDQGAVCVVMRINDNISPIVYDNLGRSRQGTQIRVYRPGEVDGRWDGPVLTTAEAVLRHLADFPRKPCSVPVQLAHDLFGWMNFARLS